MNNPIQFANPINPIRTLLAHALAAFRPVALPHVRQFAFPFLVFATILTLVPRCTGTPFEWEFTGSLHSAVYKHSATLLQNGMVLVAGGTDDHGNFFASSELYNAATGAWSVTGSLNIGRGYHTATLLPNGMVLVAGGLSAAGTEVSAELYDPASGTWSLTGSLSRARSFHSAILLPNGRVLVAGGLLTSCELYNPATGTWSVTGRLTTQHHESLSPVPLTLLGSGKVLLEGGLDDHNQPLATAEVYDPATAVWSATGNLNVGRDDHTATLLDNGMVLVAGGEDNDFVLLRSAELYDPVSGTWGITGNLNEARSIHTSTMLPNGQIVVAGGYGESEPTPSAELYDPATGSWSYTGSLNTGRGYHTATLLQNGMLLAVAGRGNLLEVLDSAELYDPGIVVMAMRVSGHGTIEGQGDQARFSFRARQSGDQPNGALTFRDPAAGISIARAKIRTLSFNGNGADMGGNARLGDGSKVTFSVSVTDNGEGTSDTFSISLSNGYSAGGTLTGGNIRIR